MINEIFFMKGYGFYVWSAFSFTFLSFIVLYFVIKPLQNTGLIDEYVAFPFASIFTKTD